MKRYIHIFCFVFWVLSLHKTYSQVPVKVWNKTFGGSNSDPLSSIVPTSDGGYILAGSSSSNISGDKSENSKGGDDYWVVKINSLGQKVWDKTFGGNGRDVLYNATMASDGGYLLGGVSYSNRSGDKSENSKGFGDYWIVKIDANGQKLWDKTYGGDFYDQLCDIVSTTDGGYLLGGFSYSSISGDKSENSRGLYDYWIIKIDSLGNKIWDKTFGGTGLELLKVIKSLPNGGFLIGGSSDSNALGDKSENSKGGLDNWIIKIDSNGNKLWDKSFGGVSEDDLSTIKLTMDGGILLGGTSSSNISGDKSENSKGSKDYWILKIDMSGLKLWDKTLGGDLTDVLSSIVENSDGGFLLGGNSNSKISGDKSENAYGQGYDYWMININANGQKVWDKIYGGSETDELKFISSIPNKSFLLGGNSFSNISGDKTENSKGGNDYWIVKLTEPCPAFSSAPANVSVSNSICSNNCTLTNGSISAPTNACPVGSTIEYSTNNGISWSSTLPVYNQTTTVNIQTRCKCLSDTTVVSAASVAVTTSPATCQLPNAPLSGGNQSVFATNPIQTLTATATAPAGSSVKWYDAASAGNVVVSPIWNTIGTKTYYATSSDNTTNCRSVTRTSVLLEIKANIVSNYIEFGLNNTHDRNAIFEVHSSNKGILFPRIDFNNRPTTNLTSGLLIYVILNGPQGNNCFYYWNGTSWVKLGNS